MVLGRLKNGICQAPEARVKLGNDVISHPFTIFDCYDDLGFKTFEFPDNELTNSKGSNAQTSLGIVKLQTG